MARSLSGKSSGSKSSSRQSKAKPPLKVTKVPSMFVNHGALKVKISKQKN